MAWITISHDYKIIWFDAKLMHYIIFCVDYSSNAKSNDLACNKFTCTIQGIENTTKSFIVTKRHEDIQTRTQFPALLGKSITNVSVSIGMEL